MSENKESAAKTDNTENRTVKTHYDMKMEQRAKAKQREKREIRAWKIAGFVVLAALVALVLSFPIRKYLAMNETICTIGGRQISRVEFDYNYNMVKNAFINNSGSYLSYYGLDINNIESQMYDETLTFKDYFEKETVNRIKQTVALSDAIAREGFTADVTADYEDYLQTMKDGAADAGVSLGEYYRQSLGEYASQKRVEKYVKESLLVSEFTDNKQSSFAPTDADIDARYKEEADDYDLFDYRLTRIDAELPTEPTELADEGAAVAEDGTYTPSEAEKKAAMDDAKVLADEAEETVMTDGELHEGEASASVVYQIRNWIVDPSRKEGDTTVIEADTTSCYYAVGFVKRYMDENTTVNLRVITTSEMTGDAILNEYYQAGNTEEAFIALVDKYTTGLKDNGGLYEGLNASILPGSLGEWAGDASRKAGDVNFYYEEESSFSYVCYYVGVGKPSWYYTIKDLIEKESMDSYLEGLTATVTVDDPKGNLRYISLEAAAELQNQIIDTVQPAE